MTSQSLLALSRPHSRKGRTAGAVILWILVFTLIAVIGAGAAWWYLKDKELRDSVVHRDAVLELIATVHHDVREDHLARVHAQVEAFLETAPQEYRQAVVFAWAAKEESLRAWQAERMVEAAQSQLHQQREEIARLTAQKERYHQAETVWQSLSFLSEKIGTQRQVVENLLHRYEVLELRGPGSTPLEEAFFDEQRNLYSQFLEQVTESALALKWEESLSSIQSLLREGVVEAASERLQTVETHLRTWDASIKELKESRFLQPLARWAEQQSETETAINLVRTWEPEAGEMRARELLETLAYLDRSAPRWEAGAGPLGRVELWTQDSVPAVQDWKTRWRPSIQIVSRPEGATVHANETTIGTTPYTHMVWPGESVALEIRHPDFDPHTLRMTAPGWGQRPTANVVLRSSTDVTAAEPPPPVIPPPVPEPEPETVEPPEPGRIYGLSDLDSLPQATFQVAPVYPFALRQEGIPGRVVVAFIIDEEGNVIDPEIESSSRPEFEQPAIDAILQWRFSPAMRQGEPVRTRVSIPLSFSIRRTR